LDASYFFSEFDMGKISGLTVPFYIMFAALPAA
jgi:hypothetical protein